MSAGAVVSFESRTQFSIGKFAQENVSDSVPTIDTLCEARPIDRLQESERRRSVRAAHLASEWQFRRVLHGLTAPLDI